MVKIIRREIVETIGDESIHIQDDKDDILLEWIEDDLFITKLDSGGSRTWVLSRELAKKLKEAL